MSGILRGPAQPVYVPDGVGVGGGGVSLQKGPAQPVYLVDASGQIFDISGMYDEVQKIDSAPVDGILGAHDSLAYILQELELHFHNDEWWFGAANVPSGEDHVADRIGTTTTPFQIDAGNATWGDWTQIAGPSDYPAGWAYADIRRMEVVYIERTNATHFLQLARGTSGAAALTAGTYSEFVFRPTTTQGRSVPLDIMTHRAISGTKWWSRCMVVGQDTGEVHFFVGAHPYPG